MKLFWRHWETASPLGCHWQELAGSSLSTEALLLLRPPQPHTPMWLYQSGKDAAGVAQSPRHHDLTKTQAHFSLIEQLAGLAWGRPLPLVLSSSGPVLIYVVEAQWSPSQEFFWSKWIKNCAHYIHWHLIGKSMVIWSQEAAVAAGKMSLSGWPQVWENWRTDLRG